MRTSEAEKDGPYYMVHFYEDDEYFTSFLARNVSEKIAAQLKWKLFRKVS